MTPASPLAPWRPYQDDPLFTAELTVGLDALGPAQTERLTGYLQALVIRRRVVHTAVAFNAIYFGYDLDYGGYVGGPVDFDRFPTVELGTVTDAPPIGAMLNIATGAEPLFAEILYKEGAHPALGPDGSLPGWLSGAPAGAMGPAEMAAAGAPVVLTERLVGDFEAFGQGLTVGKERLGRLRRRGRWLDGDGHLLFESRYRSHRDADFDDLDYYVHYLLGPARSQLIEGPLPLMLTDEAGEEGLAAALRGAMRTVADILASMDSLRRWGHYAFPRDQLATRLGDEGPLGGGDLRSVASALARPPSAGRRRFQVDGPYASYTAIGPRLRVLAGAGPRLSGLGYAVAVCHANAVISDLARRDADEAGLLDWGIHLRLDDVWQGGGVWRSSRAADPYARIDPLTPLGLGWLEEFPAVPADEAEDEPEDSGIELLAVSDSQLTWTSTLRLSHTLEGVVPLPGRVAEEMALTGLTDGPARLRLTHAGNELAEDEATQDGRLERYDGGLRLAGVAWPLEFFPGIVLTFAWPRGAPVLSATSTLLETPVLFDGERLEHRYDPRIIGRDGAPGCTRSGSRSQPMTLRARVLRTVRRAGSLDADGVAAIARDRIGAVVFGRAAGTAAAATLGPVIMELVAAGLLCLETGDRTADGLIRYPARNGGEPVDVLVWRPEIVGLTATRRPQPEPEPEQASEGPALPRYLRSYEVQPFLRRLPAGRQASEDKRAEYRRLMARYGRSGELPDGFTLVSGHNRGGSQS